MGGLIITCIVLVVFLGETLQAQNVFVPPTQAEYKKSFGSLAMRKAESDYDTAQVEWIAHYGSGFASGVDVANDVAVDVSGNVYVTGKSDGEGTARDYLTVKYNKFGVEQWAVRYDGPYHGFDIANAIAVDDAGNVYVTGMSMGSDSTLYDYATIKYDAFGVQQWLTRYNGPSSASDVAVDIELDASGNVYVTGASAGFGGEDYATIKYNAFGITQWVARYDGTANSDDEAAALALDDSGNVYVTGRSIDSTNYSNGYYGGFSDYVTVKYSSAGVQQWIARYDTDTSHAVPVDIVLDGFGNVFVTGQVAYRPWFYGPTYCDYATVKYDTAGNEQWSAVYKSDSTSIDLATSIGLDLLGNVYVSGISGHKPWAFSAGDSIVTVKYSPTGTVQWVTGYAGSGGPAFSRATLALDGLGNLYVGASVGRADSYPFVSDSILTIKYSGAGAMQWLRFYNTPDATLEAASAIALDGLGNVYVAGSSGHSQEYDFATIKYTATGAAHWVARKSGPGNSDEYVSAIELDQDGNVYITGASRNALTSFDYMTAAFDASGAEQWQTRYNGPGDKSDVPRAIAIDDFGNIYVTGSSAGVGTGDDYATIKYDSQGIEQWVARYNGPGNYDDRAYAICLDQAGNVYVAGFSEGYTTIKYNSAGVEQWLARYDSGGVVSSIVIDNAGNVYVTGFSDPYYSYLNRTIKYNSLGIQQWAASGGDDLVVDDSGNVYVSGFYYGQSWTTKYDSSGVELWSQAEGGYKIRLDAEGNIFTVGQTQLSKFHNSGALYWTVYPTSYCCLGGLDLDQSGNVYVTGTTWSADYLHGDFLTVKYNASGVMEWSARYNGQDDSHDRASALRLDLQGNVLVAGISQRRDYSDIATIVKYAQVTVSVEETDPNAPNRYWLSQNYPNPFNPKTTIRFAIAKSGFVSLKVFNMLGQEVDALVSEELAPGTYSSEWNATNVASGVYFYRLQSGDFVESKKLIVLK